MTKRITIRSSLADSQEDCGPAVRAGLAELGEDGGQIVFQPGPHPYVINSSIELKDRVAILGYGGVTITNLARDERWGNRLFVIHSASHVRLAGFAIDGQTSGEPGQPRPRMAVLIGGISSEILIEDLHCYDHQNYSIAVGGQDAQIAVRNLEIKRVTIDGDCALEGDGSGINLFPREQSAGWPRCSGFKLSRCKIDVTRGQADRRQMGPACIKVNNYRDVSIWGCSLKGGRVAAAILTNGCIDASIADNKIAMSNRGIHVDSQRNRVTPFAAETRDITIDRNTWDGSGVVGGEDLAVTIGGTPPPRGVRIRMGTE